MSEVRYRGQLFIDIFVPDTGDEEKNKLEAERIADEFASLRPNTFVGDVFNWDKMVGSKLMEGLK